MRITVMALLVGVGLLVAACGGSAESVIPYADVPQTGDAVRGEQLYNTSVNNTPACNSCHIAGQTGSPDLTGYSEVADSRVPGESAHEYTFWAIAEPGRHVLEGYGNAMYNQYDNKLTPQDIADLIAYMLTL